MTGSFRAAQDCRRISQRKGRLITWSSDSPISARTSLSRITEPRSIQRSPGCVCSREHEVGGGKRAVRGEDRISLCPVI